MITIASFFILIAVSVYYIYLYESSSEGSLSQSIKRNENTKPVYSTENMLLTLQYWNFVNVEDLQNRIDKIENINESRSLN